ncbi:hypothetical protein Goshw_006934 [Gossypium schwendimanii]|uniref:Reverse transcriptase zinc-binding domain-containing protein n=1 Tax=Gossypium schwendimanii TaxID=34291 RepID=A0A7J9LL50_GOSSC|nr:hypothetical protein [Gossypium schwendimanii]
MIISMLILLLGRRSSEEGSTLVEGILTLHDSSRVYKVPISLQTRPDQSMCHWPSNGIYSVKSRLADKGVNVATTCPRCGEFESLDHVLVSCTIAQAVWQQMGYLQSPSSLHQLIVSLLRTTDFTAALWSLWFHRNLLVWNAEDFLGSLLMLLVLFCSFGTRRNLFLDEHSLTRVMQFHRRLVRVGLVLVSLNVSLMLLLLFRTRDARVLLLRYRT